MSPDSGPATAEPSPTRPTVDVEFRMAPGLGSASGTERVTFTPDLEVCELVFRAWPNKPATAKTGSSLEVTSVRVEGSSIRPEVSSAGAPSGVPGTLVEVPLPACVPAGTAVKAELDFELRLGTGTDERVGKSQEARFDRVRGPDVRQRRLCGSACSGPRAGHGAQVAQHDGDRRETDLGQSLQLTQ